MRNVSLERGQINIESLDTTLRTELGDTYLGLSVRDGMVILHARDDISDVDIQRGRMIIQTHNASLLSPMQQAKASLETEIDNLKTRVGDINALTSSEATAAIKLLYKILKLHALI